ncbi:MAG: hypothetical protein LBQ59_04580 [Candidatus Peribacteria bacterium]|nr:hypothetical protein [Candidatus Peribacteria bacterium]
MFAAVFLLKVVILELVAFPPSMRGNTRGSCSFLRRGWVRCEVRVVGNLSKDKTA